MANKGFGSYEMAAAMRDTIERIAIGVINRMRPDTRIAEVVTINRPQLTAEVRFSGDTGKFNARFGMSLQPRSAGNIVRIAGSAGNYYITEILNDTGEHAKYEPVIEAITDPTGAVVIDGGLLGPGTVGEDQIQDLAISTVKIKNGAVTINQLSVVMGGGNKLPDSGFDSSAATVWTPAAGATLSKVSTPLRSGLSLKALRVQPTAADSGATYTLTGLTAGNPYAFSVYIYSATTRTVQVKATNLTVVKRSSNYTTVHSFTVQAGKYTRCTVVGAQAPATTSLVLLVATDSTDTTTEFFVEDVQVEEGDVVTAWNPRVDEILPGTISTAMLQTGAIIVGGSSAVVFAPGYDPSTKATTSDLTAVAEAGNLQDNYLMNATFDNWAGGAFSPPDNYSIGAGSISRETAIIRTAPYALRFGSVTGGSNHYLQPTSYPVPNTPFITVRTDVHLVSGSWTGSGILTRFFNSGGSFWDAVVEFGAYLGSSVAGNYWRVETVVNRPSGFTGTPARVEIWPIGGWTGLGTVAAKDIIFDQLSARPSTSDEIKAWTAGLWAYPGTTKINGGLIQTGTVIADFVVANMSISSPTISAPTVYGGLFSTGTSAGDTGQRVVVRNDGSGGIIEAFSGIAGEVPSRFDPSAAAGRPAIIITSGTTGTYSDSAQIQLRSDTTGNDLVELSGSKIDLIGAVRMGNVLAPQTPINGIIRGTSTASTNASGDVQVTGSWNSYTPEHLFISQRTNAQTYYVTTSTRGVNSFTCTVRDRATGAAVGSGIVVNFDWFFFI